MTGLGSGARSGPFLELAYWIGPTPGVDTANDATLGVYRDEVNRGNNPDHDRFVVMHLHMEDNRDMLRTIGERVARVQYEHANMLTFSRRAHVYGRSKNHSISRPNRQGLDGRVAR